MKENFHKRNGDWKRSTLREKEKVSRGENSGLEPGSMGKTHGSILARGKASNIHDQERRRKWVVCMNAGGNSL